MHAVRCTTPNAHSNSGLTDARAPSLPPKKTYTHRPTPTDFHHNLLARLTAPSSPLALRRFSPNELATLASAAARCLTTSSNGYGSGGSSGSGASSMQQAVDSVLGAVVAEAGGRIQV